MSEDDVRDLIHSVVERGSTLGVTATAAEIRTKFSRTGGTAAPRAAAASPLRRRVAVLLVAALILAVFFVPFPHLGLFNHFVTPAGRSTTVTSVTAPRTTSRNVPSADLTLTTVWTVGASAGMGRVGPEHPRQRPGTRAQHRRRQTLDGRHASGLRRRSRRRLHRRPLRSRRRSCVGHLSGHLVRRRGRDSHDVKRRTSLDARRSQPRSR